MATRVRSEDWQLTDIVPAPKDAPNGAVGELQALHSTGWFLKAFVGEVAGVPVLLDLRLEWLGNAVHGQHDHQDFVVSGQVLHSIPVGRLIRETIAKVAADQRQRRRQLAKSSPPSGIAERELDRQPGPRNPSDLLAAGGRLMAENDMRALSGFPSQPPRRGRRGRSDEEYRRIANAVLDLQKEDPKHVVLRLADQEDTHEETMRSR